MECPKKKHRKYQRDFPMAPEKIKVTEDMLSPEQIEIKNIFDISVGETDKLITNVLPREKYVTHYRNLKYLSMGLRLTAVHSILRFKQEPWMRDYNDNNTQKRTEATNDADKNFFKLMIMQDMEKL